MKHILLSLFSLSIIIACQSETQTDQKNELIGDWVFETASINGDVKNGSELLSGTSFSFTEDKISSNLLPELGVQSATADYEYKGNELVIADNKIRFEIQKLEADKLSIKFEAAPDGHPMQFEIDLKKQ